LSDERIERGAQRSDIDCERLFGRELAILLARWSEWSG
jgi:hypothetical protein